MPRTDPPEPVPGCQDAGQRDDHLMPEVVLMSDPRVATVPVQECGEPLVDVRQHSPLLVGRRKCQDSEGAFAHLRQGVLTRLFEAQSLLPPGLRLLFVEGYRPPTLQRHYFDKYATRLRAEHPEWSPDRIRSAASRCVSPPEIAPHSAGATVDLTLTGPRHLLHPSRRHHHRGPHPPHGPGNSPHVRRPGQLPDRVVLPVEFLSSRLGNWPQVLGRSSAGGLGHATTEH